MTVTRSRPRTAVMALAGIIAISAAALAGEIEVIFTEVPGHPTAQVPGAKDLGGNPVSTEFKAMELFSVSPDGSEWVLKARNWLGSDLESMLLKGSGTSGSVFAQEGQPVHDGAPGEIYDFFGSSPPYFNEIREFCYTARARGGVSTIKQKGIHYDGVTYTIVREESDPALGLLDQPPDPSGDELFGNSFGSMHVLNDGTFGYQDGTIKNLYYTRYPAIFYNSTSFRQSGVSPVGGGTWDSLDSNTFWTTPDGTTWIVEGDDEGSTAQDKILVVNDVVVLREGTTVPGSTMILADIFDSKLVANGYWYSRGDDPNNDDWAVRNGTLVAKTGDAIVTGILENWTDVFYSFTGNQHGDWVLAGKTDNGDIQTDSVIVLNGTEVLVREGDPVDLDGNGVFDDDAFIGRGDATLGAFHPDDIFLTDDLVMYFLVSLRNAAGQDLGTFGSGGDAFLRYVPGPDVCAGDASCDGQIDFGDINPFVAAMLCVAEPDPAACWEALYPGCPYENADVDESGIVSFGDINPFVDVLVNSSLPVMCP